MLEYITILPDSPLLRPVIHSYALLTGDAAAASKALPPRAGAVLSVTISGARRVDGARAPDAAVFGIRENAALLEMEDSRVDRIHVQFSPCGLASVTEVPASHIANQVIAARELFPAEMIERLEAGLRAARAPERRRAVLDWFFLSLLRQPGTPQLEVQAATEALCADPLQGLDAFFSGLSVGVRQAERLFAKMVGVSPRSFLRIARFERARQEMASHHGRGLAEIGLDAGYYDQPHFSREFRRLSSMTPGAFRSCARSASSGD